MKREHCEMRTIARGSNITVSVCSHGTVHVNLGDVTLRMSIAGLRKLGATLDEALEVCDLDEAAQTPMALN